MEREEALARLERAQELCRQLKGPAAAEALGQLDTEMDGIEATLDWLQVQGDAEDAFRLASALHLYWMERGRYADGRARLQRLLRETADVACPARVDVLHAASLLAFRQGDQEAARWLARQELALADVLDDVGGVAQAHVDLCRVALRDGAAESALSHAETALSLFRSIGDDERGALPLHLIAEAERLRGGHARARHFYELSLSAARRRGHERMVANELYNLSCLARADGRLDEAEALLRDAFTRAQRLGDSSSEAYTLAGLGCIAATRGDARRAVLLLSAAQARLAATGEVLDPTDQADVDDALARVRAALDPESFEAARAQGGSLRAADALTLAGIARERAGHSP